MSWKMKILVCFFTLGLISCDNSSEPSVKNTSKIDVVNIGRLICGGHLPLAIVEKKYQNSLKNFKLNTIQNHDWHDVVRDMKSGKLDGTFILSPLAMELIRKGFPGKIVLMAERNGNGFVLSKKIKSINELKEKSAILAVPHLFSQHNVLLHDLLKKHDIPLKNITILAMPPRDMINALRSGGIDGFLVGEPEGQRSISLDVGYLAAISPDIWLNHMDHVFMVTDKVIKEKPKQLQNLINQLVRGGRFINQNPKLAAIMGENYTGAQAQVFENVLTKPKNRITYLDVLITNKDLKEMAFKLVTMNLWPNVPKNILTSYIDMSFARQALDKAP